MNSLRVERAFSTASFLPTDCRVNKGSVSGGTTGNESHHFCGGETHLSRLARGGISDVAHDPFDRVEGLLRFLLGRIPHNIVELRVLDGRENKAREKEAAQAEVLALLAALVLHEHQELEQRPAQSPQSTRVVS